MAAIATLALTMTPGDRVILPDDVYGGTYRLFSQVTEGLGIRVATVDMTDLEQVAAITAEGASLVFSETPTNPLLKVLDLRALAAAAHEAGALLAVDNTFATPFIQRPLELGADVVVYSGTKYLGGHSDLVAGSLATADDELGGRLRWLQNSVGAVPGPFDSWLLLRGLKTLAVRMKAHCSGAMVVARWLDEQDSVEVVHYPGLPGWPGHRLASEQMDAPGCSSWPSHSAGSNRSSSTPLE
jgi:cystathionine gamma-synthase